VCHPGTDIRPAVFGIAAAQGWPLRELSLEMFELEDVFIKLTASAGLGKTKDDPRSPSAATVR